MTEPNQDRSYRFYAKLEEFLTWGQGRERLTVHKVAVARANRSRSVGGPFGERRLLYSMQVDIAALKATADEAVHAFEVWERALDFKACPEQIEDDESKIIVV
jgi:hypothetical protein